MRNLFKVLCIIVLLYVIIVGGSVEVNNEQFSLESGVGGITLSGQGVDFLSNGIFSQENSSNTYSQSEPVPFSDEYFELWKDFFPPETVQAYKSGVDWQSLSLDQIKSHPENPYNNLEGTHVLGECANPPQCTSCWTKMYHVETSATAHMCAGGNYDWINPCPYAWDFNGPWNWGQTTCP